MYEKYPWWNYRIWFTDMMRSEGEERDENYLDFSNHAIWGILMQKFSLPNFDGPPHFPEFSPNDICSLRKWRHWVWPEENKTLPPVGSTYINSESLWSLRDVKVLVTLCKYSRVYHGHCCFLKNVTQVLWVMPNEKFQKTFWAMLATLNTDTNCQYISVWISRLQNGHIFHCNIHYITLRYVTLRYVTLHYITLPPKDMPVS